MSEGDQRGGTGPRGRRPSRRMRERADEMADLLDRAAPTVRAHRRRRSVALPAAVVALGALTVGGVGVAVGLDNEPTSNTTPPSPSAPIEAAPPADPSPATDIPVTDGATDTGTRARTDAVDRIDATDTPDRSSTGARSAPPRALGLPPRAPRAAPPTTTGRDGGRSDDGDERDGRGEETPRSAPSTTRPSDDESPEETTTSRTSPREGSATDRSTRPGAGDARDRTDLRADSRGTGAVLPSPTGDGE